MSPYRKYQKAIHAADGTCERARDAAWAAWNTSDHSPRAMHARNTAIDKAIRARNAAIETARQAYDRERQPSRR